MAVERHRLELHALPPFPTIGVEVEFWPDVQPAPSAPLPWRLHPGDRAPLESSTHQQPLRAGWQDTGTVLVRFECERGQAERTITVVGEYREELWHLLRESSLRRDTDLMHRWEESLRRRFGLGFQEERTRQEECDRRIRSEVGNLAQQARWLNSRPLARIPRDVRPDLLQDCIASALRAGWRMPVPEAFGPWFHRIRFHEVIDYFRSRKTRATPQEDNEQPLSQTLADDSIPEDRGELGFDALHAVATSLAAGQMPGRNLIRDAGFELLDAFGLAADMLPTATQFILSLRGKPANLLDLYVLPWAHRQHLAKLSKVDPIHEAAFRLADRLDFLVQFQELRQRGNAQLAERYTEMIRPLFPERPNAIRLPGLVEVFAECRQIVDQTLRDYRGPWNPALRGDYFAIFEGRFPALQVLAPAWRLMEWLSGEASLRIELTALRQRLESSLATSHLDGAIRKQLVAHRDTLCSSLMTVLPPIMPPLALLVLWLHLATERGLQNRWVDALAELDRRWWKCQLLHSQLDDAERAIEELFGRIAPCGSQILKTLGIVSQGMAPSKQSV